MTEEQEAEGWLIRGWKPPPFNRRLLVSGSAGEKTAPFMPTVPKPDKNEKSIVINKQVGGRFHGKKSGVPGEPGYRPIRLPPPPLEDEW